MARLSHLIRRFFGSLRPGGPSTDDQVWAESQLLPGERAIWCEMSGPDRRHSAGVAREVERRLGVSVPRPVLAAALLHDCGKLQSGLRTPGRVVATVLCATTVRTPDAVAQWATSNSGFRRSIGQYRLHPEIGAELLVAAGSDSLTVAWTREHHQPRATWTIDPSVAAALHAADDD
jgi:hypothetical protein